MSSYCSWVSIPSQYCLTDATFCREATPTNPLSGEVGADLFTLYRVLILSYSFTILELVFLVV
jgi:hypothetical protein